MIGAYRHCFISLLAYFFHSNVVLSELHLQYIVLFLVSMMTLSYLFKMFIEYIFQIVFFGFLSTINGFDLQCPHLSQRTYRIRSVCNGNSSAYTCLYDTRKKGYIEFCTNRKDNYVRAGMDFSFIFLSYWIFK